LAVRGYLETKEVVRRLVGKRVEGHELSVRHMADLLDISEQAIRSHLKSLGGRRGNNNGSATRTRKVRG
jgi:predicted ArsR family transcriptional regulator